MFQYQSIHTPITIQVSTPNAITNPLSFGADYITHGSYADILVFTLDIVTDKNTLQVMVYLMLVLQNS